MWDADGRGCGNDTAAIDYPYLYFPMINLTEIQGVSKDPKSTTKELLKFGTCVKECPGSNGTVECLKPNYMINNPNYGYAPCTYTILVTYTDPSDGKEKKKNVFDVRYPTEVVGGKVCFPVIDPQATDEIGQMMNTFYNETLSQLNESGVTDYINDTLATWQVLLIGLGSAFLIGFIFLFLLRWIVAPVVWGSIFATVGLMGYGGYMLFDIGTKLPEQDEYKMYYTYGSYVVWGILALLIIFLCCNCRNIKIGIAVMKTTADFLKDTP